MRTAPDGHTKHHGAWRARLVSWKPARLGRMAIAVGLGTLAAITIVPTAAQAAFPGVNGLVVFSGTGASWSRFCRDRHQQDQLFELTAEESSPVQLTCTSGRDEHPFVSPDGSEVVFSNVTNGGVSQLFTLDLSSTGRREFAQPVLVSDAPQASDDDSSWSPAGDGTIVFQRTLPGSPSQLYFENVADPSSAAPIFATPTGFNDTEPVFDPSDPDVIAFVRPVGGHSHIFSYDVTTQALTDLSAQGNGGGSGDDAKPDFAPTGAEGRIVFESDRNCGYMQLYTMTTQGTDQSPVFPTSSRKTPSGSEACSSAGDDPVYSPQGDQLAFDRQGDFPRGDDQGRGFAYEDHEWGGWSNLSFVPIDSSGTATGNATGIRGYGTTGVQPSWGPEASPPADAPEAPLPIILPVMGAGVAGTVLFIRRRGARRERPALV
jgi:Tol biopolymer transport system component